jgi:aminomethyltransferase
MADFGGWLMPIEYPGSGVLAEHLAVRERVGLFDVSHLGKASVKGEGALEFLNSELTNDLNRIGDSQAQYTMICNEQGGVIDDLIAYRNSPTDFFLIPNASNTSEVVATINEAKPAGIEIVNLHEEYAVLALQGPQAFAVIESLCVTPAMDYMAFTHVTIAGCDVILCRTGYTGEHGYELLPRWSDALTVWNALEVAMQPFDGLICGLGARDTLRTEMGYPLHGHELTPEISPVQAGSTWAVGWKKRSFRGSVALANEKERGPTRRLRGLAATDRGIPRAGMDVKSRDGQNIGIVTSGTFSPSLKKGIALALLAPEFSIGDEVIIDVRGRQSVATIIDLPMVASHVR